MPNSALNFPEHRRSFGQKCVGPDYGKHCGVRLTLAKNWLGGSCRILEKRVEYEVDRTDARHLRLDGRGHGGGIGT